ncbi:hypothetical protein ACCD10_30630 [Pseudomonas sp. Pseusp122]
MNNAKSVNSKKPDQKLSTEAKKFMSTRNNGGGGHCQGGGNW